MSKSIFHDQATFMAAAGNVYPDCCNDKMLILADDLLTEEFNELMDEEPWVNPLSDNPRKQYSKKDKIKKKLKRKLQRKSRKLS